jgi:nucleoside-diphosphate-sugar epimerase
MIVGNGLVANSIRELDEEYLETIFFASGVSNSVNPKEKDFEREKKLLSSFYENKNKLVYFSTCSVFDKTLLGNSNYVSHKLEMEKLIKIYFKNYIILRLPTLVGKTKNPNTLFNYFLNKLRLNEDISIYKNSNRFLFDAIHLSSVIRLFLEEKNLNQIINAAFPNSISVSELVEYMKLKLNSNSNLIGLNKGQVLMIENSDFVLKTNELKLDFSPFNIIDRYL